MVGAIHRLTAGGISPDQAERDLRSKTLQGLEGEVLTRAEVDKLLLVLVRSYMTKDEEAYLATCRLLCQYVVDTKTARGMVQIGAGTWTRDPGLFSYKYRHERKGLSDEELRAKLQETKRKLREAALRRKRRYSLDPVLVSSC